MNTSQIQCCIDCSSLLSKSIIGVYAADQLPSFSNYDKQFPYGFIANTDEHTKPGKHWCAFYFPNRLTVEYLDSYGMPIEYFNHYFPEYVKKCSNVIFNSKQLQSVNSDVCGMYCLYFMIKRLNGVSFYDFINSFSNDLNFNDFEVYNYFSTVFSECMHNICVKNQACKAIKYLKKYLFFVLPFFDIFMFSSV